VPLEALLLIRGSPLEHLEALGIEARILVGDRQVDPEELPVEHRAAGPQDEDRRRLAAALLARPVEAVFARLEALPRALRLDVPDRLRDDLVRALVERLAVERRAVVRRRDVPAPFRSSRGISSFATAVVS
jgi:hypothetical protein